jgi:UDP-glucose 4-epimerase
MNYDQLLNNKRILITGGAGFVGSQLAKRLFSNNNNVYVLDNYFTGTSNNHIKGIHYKKGETKNIFKYFKNIKLDYIYHLGEYSRVEQSYEDIELVMNYNLYPFYDVLRLASHHKAKLIYSGSSTKFSHNLDVVESPYSFSKKMNTELLVKYAKWFNLEYAITYFYNVYGPNEISQGKYSTVIAKFLFLKKNNNKYLPITKPGTQKRRFTHIDDIVNGLILVGKKGIGDNFGIGADKSFTIIEIAKMLKMNYKMMSAKMGNRLDATLKTSKTKKLGWKPLKNLKNYLNSHAK